MSKLDISRARMSDIADLIVLGPVVDAQGKKHYRMYDAWSGKELPVKTFKKVLADATVLRVKIFERLPEKWPQHWPRLEGPKLTKEQT